ncbi:MAG: hypothetical protein IJ561_00980 [Ruminococcus sp.]|nr:hypothetical protein [Ruminococcus sp.]
MPELYPGCRGIYFPSSGRLISKEKAFELMGNDPKITAKSFLKLYLNRRQTDEGLESMGMQVFYLPEVKGRDSSELFDKALESLGS